MSRQWIVCAVLGLLAACSGDHATQTPSSIGGNPATTGDGSTDRAAFIESIDQQLEIVGQQLGELEQRVAAAEANAKPQLEAALANLTAKRDALQQKLADFKNSLLGESESVRREIRDSCRSLRESLQKALQGTS